MKIFTKFEGFSFRKSANPFIKLKDTLEKFRLLMRTKPIHYTRPSSRRGERRKRIVTVERFF